MPTIDFTETPEEELPELEVPGDPQCLPDQHEVDHNFCDPLQHRARTDTGADCPLRVCSECGTVLMDPVQEPPLDTEAATTAFEEITPREPVLPNYGSGFFPLMLRQYGAILALYMLIEAGAEGLTREMLAANIRDARLPMVITASEGYHTLGPSLAHRVSAWNHATWRLLENTTGADQIAIEAIYADIKNAVETLYPILASFDTELLGLPTPDGGTTP